MSSTPRNPAPVAIIGGGLAGCEAAWKLGRAGVSTRLFEMRPKKSTPAHVSGELAELVCSNSLKAKSPANASGLLKAEMEILGSLVMEAALENAVPAGGALAVDREGFARWIGARIESLPSVEIVREEVAELPAEGVVVVASGPLTSDALAGRIAGITGAERLYFYDAIAPVVSAESINMEVAFRASRYGKGGDDYINCPLNEYEYGLFIDELLSARRVPLRDFEDARYFEGCLPLEVMAERGRETLAHGPMKPVGLTDPRAGRRPHAVVQLRRDDKAGTLYNLVGFQTRLAQPEQERVFRMIPGLEKAEFMRLGSIHRNTFIDSPRLLTPELRLRADGRVLFAGQITGVEGYLESAATGILAGINAIRIGRGKGPAAPPATTVTGALMAYVTDPERAELQPMNANFGVLAPLAGRHKKSQRKELYGRRAVADMEEFARRVGIEPGAPSFFEPSASGEESDEGAGTIKDDKARRTL